MSEIRNITLQKINEKLTKGSLVGTGELADFVDLIYDGWEELRDGFDFPDILSLAGSIGKAWVGKKVAIMESMDLQDSEIDDLVERSIGFNLNESADEARQVVKWLLVTVQTYDKLIFEKQKRSSE